MCRKYLAKGCTYGDSVIKCECFYRQTCRNEAAICMRCRPTRMRRLFRIERVRTVVSSIMEAEQVSVRLYSFAVAVLCNTTTSTEFFLPLGPPQPSPYTFSFEIACISVSTIWVARGSGGRYTRNDNRLQTPNLSGRDFEVNHRFRSSGLRIHGARCHSQLHLLDVSS